MTAFRKLVLCIFATVAPLAAAPAGAQNLLTNGDFDSGLGLDSWNNGTGSWILGDDSGSCLLSDAAQGTSALASTDQFLSLYSTQCISVDPSATPTLQIGALYQTAASVWARLYLQFFSDAGCANHLGWSGFAFGSTSPEWTAVGGPIELDPTAVAVRVWADFNPMVAGIPQFTGALDRFYLGLLPQLLVDSFEAEGGSACHWSAVIP